MKTSQEKQKLSAAAAYAAKKHEGQKRNGGEPYITHPLAVAELLEEDGYPVDYQLCGIFHDLLEDTNAIPWEIEALSSPEVLEAVLLLTKQPGYQMEEYVEKIRQNPMAKAVKAKDRLHNLCSAIVCSREFKERYIQETEKWYMDFDPQIPAAVENLKKKSGIRN